MKNFDNILNIVEQLRRLLFFSIFDKFLTIFWDLLTNFVNLWRLLRIVNDFFGIFENSLIMFYKLFDNLLKFMRQCFEYYLQRLLRILNDFFDIFENSLAVFWDLFDNSLRTVMQYFGHYWPILWVFNGSSEMLMTF